MGKVISSASMSLDGYIAKDDNSIGRLFDWLQNGDVEVLTRTGSGDMSFHLSRRSAPYWREWTSGLGALVCGRTLFDVTNGWSGRHNFDVPVVMGRGRPYFGEMSLTDVALGDPTVCIQGDRVTHLVFPVSTRLT